MRVSMHSTLLFISVDFVYNARAATMSCPLAPTLNALDGHAIDERASWWHLLRITEARHVHTGFIVMVYLVRRTLRDGLARPKRSDTLPFHSAQLPAAIPSVIDVTSPFLAYNKFSSTGLCAASVPKNGHVRRVALSAQWGRLWRLGQRCSAFSIGVLTSSEELNFRPLACLANGT